VKRRMTIGGLVAAAQIWCLAGAFAGPWEDGMVSYNRGDYMPAIRLFRPLAEKGNARAQHLIGVMYHKGEGVARNSVRALAWFSLAAKRGDRDAKAKLRDLSKTMTPDEISQAHEMAKACEASDYRSCEY
jgi:TPR repeat protein